MYTEDTSYFGDGGGGGYSTTGYVEDDPWWEDLWNVAGRLIQGEYPKPLPPPLPFTVAQVRAMLQNQPTIRTAIRSKIQGQGHTHLYLGRQPTAADLDNVQTLAELALWFGNGTGDDLSRGEHEIRNLLIQGMQAEGAATGGGGSGGGWTGGGVPNIPGPTVEAGGMALLLAAGVGAYLLTRKG